MYDFVLPSSRVRPDLRVFLQPERISGQSYSIRSDVWSAGLSLLELVTNKFPFPHDIGPIDLIFYITQSDVSVVSMAFHICGLNQLS